MPEVPIRYGLVLACALANFFLSWAWYSPLMFAKPWAKALGRELGRPMTADEKRTMPWLLLMGLLSSFLKMLVLAAAIRGLDTHGPVAGASVGLLAWLGFTLPSSLDTLWEGRPGLVLAVNNGLFAVSYVLFGAVLATWS